MKIVQFAHTDGDRLYFAFDAQAVVAVTEEVYIGTSERGFCTVIHLGGDVAFRTFASYDDVLTKIGWKQAD